MVPSLDRVDTSCPGRPQTLSALELDRLVRSSSALEPDHVAYRLGALHL
jgi:hypothetical protein